MKFDYKIEENRSLDAGYYAKTKNVLDDNKSIKTTRIAFLKTRKVSYETVDHQPFTFYAALFASLARLQTSKHGGRRHNSSSITGYLRKLQRNLKIQHLKGKKQIKIFGEP